VNHQPVNHRYVNHRYVNHRSENRPSEDRRHEHRPGRTVAHRTHRGDQRPNDRRPSEKCLNGANPLEIHSIEILARPGRTSAETVARRNYARRCRETIQWRDEENGQRA
jgi:hypothetical protein